MRRLLLLVLVLLVAGAAALYYYRPDHISSVVSGDRPADDGSWLDQLYSQNPTESAAATRQVEELGVGALPTIRTTLHNPGADKAQVKAALKACGILGAEAASEIGAVAARMQDPELTSEAAVALSFMGRAAFVPLRSALRSEDPIVRREALRALGKLTQRTSLETDTVLPLLIEGMADDDSGVRAIAATYLGIIHEGAPVAVEALVEGLKDEEPEVRRCSATALGSFGEDAIPALPALRRAMGDTDQEVAREAGVSVVKLQTKQN